MSGSAPSLQDLGERGLLALLAPYFGRGEPICVPVGDDAAVLALPPGAQLVATTDLLFEGVHFSEQTTTAYDAGWRAAAANLSDLAAMGASSLGMLVGLGLPPDTPVAWIEGFYQGFTACCAPWKAPILGGDTCRAAIRAIAVTALGSVEPSRILRRGDVHPGDALVVTGTLGDSRAGLEVLLHPERFGDAHPDDLDLVIAAHQRPIPRLDVPALIWEHTDRAAAMDTSDGLADALIQVTEQSRCGARLDTRRLPLSTALCNLAGRKAVDWALYGGEDFELLIALPEAAAAALVTALLAAGIPGAIIGEAIAGCGVIDEAGCFLGRPAFQHF